MTRPGLILAAALVLSLSVPALSSPREVEFAVFSDPHFYDRDLGTTGSAFERYLASDRKMLVESGAILDAALAAILDRGVDFVVVPGDLTKDGALLSHQGFADRLRALTDAGLPVLVVPGNHDVANPHAYRYEGDSAIPVENVSPAEFEALYDGFGYARALGRDPASLSYVAEPVDGVWVIGIDSCRYAENEAAGAPVTGGRIPDATMAWVATVLRTARENHKRAIAFLHHGVLEHFPGQASLFPDYLLEEWESSAAALAGAGLELVFTGHFHAQDCVRSTATGRTLTDVETGSLVTFPSPVRFVTLDRGGEAAIESWFVAEIDQDTGGVPFPEYARSLLGSALEQITLGLLTLPRDQGGFGLEPSDPAVATLSGLAADAILAHIAGDELPSAETLAAIASLTASADPVEQLLGLSLAAVWTDPPPEDTGPRIPLRPLGAAVALGDRVHGRIDEVSETDRYEIYLTEGSRARLEIKTVDGTEHPSLAVLSPDGAEWGTTDRGRRRGKLVLDAPLSGLYTVLVTGAAAESLGAYRLKTKGRVARPRIRVRRVELAPGETLVFPPAGEPPLDLPAAASVRIRARGRGPKAVRPIPRAVLVDPLGRPLEAVAGRTSTTLGGGHRVRVSADDESPVAGGLLSLRVTCRVRPRRAVLAESE